MQPPDRCLSNCTRRPRASADAVDSGVHEEAESKRQRREVAYATIRRIWCFGILVATLSGLLVAGEARDAPVSYWQEHPVFYRRNYLLVGGARAVGLQSTAEKFAPGKVLPVVVYRYYSSDEWFSGIGAQYLHLIEQEKELILDDRHVKRDTSFALARIYLESSYQLRLYHPGYLSLGFRVFYLYPLQPPLLPNSRHEGYAREIGVSAVAALNLYASDEISLHVTAERWRGVNTSRLHGVEFALLIGHPL